jgi:hypothetical protein
MMAHTLVVCEVKHVDFAQVIFDAIATLTMCAELAPQQ